MREFWLLRHLILVVFWLSSCAHQQTVDTKSIWPHSISNRDLSENLSSLTSEQKQYYSTEYFIKAQSLLLEGKFVESKEFLKALLILSPDQEVKRKLAVVHVRLGELEAAGTLLEDIVTNSNYKDDKTAMLWAGVLSAQEKIEDAKLIYRKILADSPKHEEACLYLGKTLAVEKKMTEAKNQFLKCDEIHKNNGIFLYSIGKMYVDSGELEKALVYFEKSYKKSPQMSQTVQALGIIYEEKELWSEAINLYKKFLKTNPTDEPIISRIVQVLFQKEKFDEVISYAETLSDLDPENLNLKVKLGVLYSDIKQYDKAISVFKDILQAAPASDRVLYYIGAIYQEQNQFEVAIDYFNQIPDESPLYSDCHFQIAQMLTSLAVEEREKTRQDEKWYKELSQHIDKSKSKFPQMKIDFALILASFYEQVAEVGKSLKELEVYKDDAEFQTQHLYFYANLLEKQSRHQEATEVMMSIIGKDPKNAHAWNFLGYSLVDRGEKLHIAFEYLQRANELSPNDGYIKDSLGWYYFKKGDLKSALKECKEAYRLVPTDGVIVKHLAILYQANKKFAEAKKLFEEAIKLVKNPQDKKEIAIALQVLEKERLPASEN